MALIQESKELTNNIGTATSVEDIRQIAQNAASQQGHRTHRDAEGRFAKQPMGTVLLNESEKMNDALSRAGSADEVRALLYQAAVAQGVAVPDAYDPTVLIPTGRQAQVESEHIFSKVEVIGGKSMSFEAASEAELTRQITDAYRVAEQLEESKVPDTRAVEHLAGVAEPVDAVTKADLEMKFRLGQISAEEFLVASGAVGDYLAKRGVDVDGLRGVVENDRAITQVKSWQNATQEFLANSDWPGGEKNKAMIGLKLQEMGLAFADDKVAALAQAYAEMKRTGMLFPVEPAPVDEKLVQSILTAPRGANGTDLDPQVIVENWKAEVRALGGDPNKELIETHRNGRLSYTGKSVFCSSS